MALIQSDIVFNAVLFLLLLLGLINYMTSFEENRCQMTYMHEMPQFIPVKLPASATSKFPRYQLFVYGEGYYAEQLRHGRYNGIPVLFIPGNAGSYKQVRSLGSVSYQRSKQSSTLFNYFAVDLNEEYSGIYGGVLQDQTDFVNLCIKHILSLYKTSGFPNTSIILVGHSMGGVIARALITLKNFNPKHINMIFTQASPHRPLAMFDLQMGDFYQRVNSLWKRHRKGSLNHINFVSVGGGHRDVLVRSSVIALPYEESHLYDIQSLTSAIPGVWLSNDHNSIVWCKQLVLLTTRAMFAMVDPFSNQIIPDSMKRADILHYHFVRKPSKLSYEIFNKYTSDMKLNANAEWNIYRKSSWFFIQSKIIALRYLTIPIRRDGTLIVIAKNVPPVNWLFTCKAKSENIKQLCTVGEAITDVTQLPFADGLERKMSMFRLSNRWSATHAVIQVEPSTKEVEVYAEVFEPDDRFIEFSVPWMPLLLVRKRSLLEQSMKSALYYNISMVGFRYLWQAYKINIKTLSQSCTRENTGIVRFYEPWTSNDIYSYIKPKAITNVVIMLQSPPPVSMANWSPQLHLYLDPQCMYRITISVSIMDVMGQIIRHYVYIFPALVVAIVSYTMSSQLQYYRKQGVCPSLQKSISVNYGLLTVVLPTYIILFLIRHDEVISRARFLPTLLDYPMETWNVHWTPFLIFFYILMVAFVKAFGLLMKIPTTAIGYTSSYILYKRQLKEPGELSERIHVLGVGSSVFSAAFISCAYASCGNLILTIGLLFYFLKVGYLQGKFRQAENRGRDVRRLSRSTHMNYALCLLWCLMCALTVPSAIAWLRNLKYGARLNPDPSLFPTVILIISLGFMWDDEGIELNRAACRLASWVLHLIAIGALCIGINHLYFVVFFTCGIFICMDLLLMISLYLQNKSKYT